MERQTFKAHAYQERAIGWVEAHERSLLFLEMGLGKSVITLTAAQHLIEQCEAERVLVVAPKKVAEGTWSTEAGKWSHLWLRVSNVTGTAARRRKALAADAEVYVIGRDTLVWLTEQECAGFDMVVLDELTSFKNHRSQRFKAAARLTASAKRVVGLTGTPTPNGLIDLWAQVYVIDHGARLGRFITRYRETYFNQIVRNNIPIKVWPKPETEQELQRLISDITLTMRSEDWLTLPPLLEEDVPVELGEAELARYRRFEREKILEEKERAQSGAESGPGITAVSAAALVGKLSQYANGAIYDDEHNVHELHTEKLAALDEILEGEPSPVLCFYQFRHDCDRILQAFRKVKPQVYEGEEQLQAWNAGKIRLLLAHPASTAFGLNMQHGGHVAVWFSTGWNLEYYQQANARLHRQGQSQPVRVLRLIARGTVDERMAAAIGMKSEGQKGFLQKLVGEMVSKED